MRPAAHSSAAAAAAAVFPQAEENTTCSVPWLFSAMPLPQPVASFDVPYSTANGEEELDRSSDRSPSHSPDGSGAHENRFWRPPAGDNAGPRRGGVRHTSKATEGDVGGAGAVDTAAAADDDNESSLRFVCHVEAARLLATTVMGVLGDGGGGGGEDGEAECTRVLQACEAFFATFERSYCG